MKSDYEKIMAEIEERETLRILFEESSGPMKHEPIHQGDVVSVTDSHDRSYQGEVLRADRMYLSLEPLEGERVEIVVPRAYVTKIIMRPSVVRLGLATLVKGWNELDDDQQMFWRIEAEDAIIETGHFEIAAHKNVHGMTWLMDGGA